MLVSLLRKRISESHLSVSNLDYILVSVLHSSYTKASTIGYNLFPIGGDFVCCGHELIGLNPETAHTSLEDSEDRKTQQTLNLNSQPMHIKELMPLLERQFLTVISHRVLNSFTTVKGHSHYPQKPLCPRICVNASLNRLQLIK